MDVCDVLIVGGGPAGSTCAWKLRQAGLDAVIVDKAAFPRDKVCAGWITPAVVHDLQIDRDAYHAGRVFQPITTFRVGVVGTERVVEVPYGQEVSFGIRRCEFDDYLLRRSGARAAVEPVAHVRRDGSHWIVNDRIAAPMLVGAGGHFCPVSRMLNGSRTGVPVVAAQEVELPLDDGACPVTGERPEIYFCEDLAGYGWCIRKGRYVNVGLGRFDRRGIHGAVDRFVEFLRTSHRLAADPSSWKWRGHAYETAGGSRQTTGNGVLLAGDAAGLASSMSGEGIGPAVRSGLMAAAAIVNARGRYDRDRLEPYAKALRERNTALAGGLVTRVLPRDILTLLALRAMRRSWFVRRIVLDRWFLHAS